MYRRFGELSLRSDSPEEAIKYFEKALELNPKSVSTNLMLVIACKKIGKEKESQKYYEIAESYNI